MSQSELALFVLVLIVFASGNVLATANTLYCHQSNNQFSQLNQVQWTRSNASHNDLFCNRN